MAHEVLERSMAESTEYKLISADSHVLEPWDLFEKRLPAALKARAPKRVEWNGASAWDVEGGDPIPLPETAGTGSGYRPGNPAEGKGVSDDNVLLALRDPAERLKAQEADSVDAEILYPSTALWDAIKQLDDAELKLACVRAYNDWIAEFCAHSPNRLIGVGKAPTTSVEDAVAEARRCVKDLKLRGLLIDAWPSGAPVGGAPADDPFWEAVNELNVPVTLHFAVGAAADTLPSGDIGPGMRPPMADSVLPMVAAGVFDRFPNVRVVLAHGDASWAIHWLEFNDMYYLRHRHLSEYALKDPNALPSEYIRKHVWFTFHQDRPAVRNRHNLGPAHLVWGSHFPYDDSNWPDNRQQAVRVTAEAPPEVQHDLMAANVARLYRLPGYEQGFTAEKLKEFSALVHY
jgi:predicted TIM-barrel fold metal-dependent hydrolase